MRHSHPQLPRKSHHCYQSSKHYSDGGRDVKYCHSIHIVYLSYYMACNFTFSVPRNSALFIYTAINYTQNTQDRQIDRNWIRADIDTAQRRYLSYIASRVMCCAPSLTPSRASESPENTVIVLLILCITYLQFISTRDAVRSSTHPCSATSPASCGKGGITARASMQAHG